MVSRFAATTSFLLPGSTVASSTPSGDNRYRTSARLSSCASGNSTSVRTRYACTVAATSPLICRSIKTACGTVSTIALLNALSVSDGSGGTGCGGGLRSVSGRVVDATKGGGGVSTDTRGAV